MRGDLLSNPWSSSEGNSQDTVQSTWGFARLGRTVLSVLLESRIKKGVHDFEQHVSRRMVYQYWLHVGVSQNKDSNLQTVGWVPVGFPFKTVQKGYQTCVNHAPAREKPSPILWQRAGHRRSCTQASTVSRGFPRLRRVFFAWEIRVPPAPARLETCGVFEARVPVSGWFKGKDTNPFEA